MDTSQSDSSDYSCDKRRSKSDTNTYYTSSHFNTTDTHSDHSDSSDTNCDSSDSSDRSDSSDSSDRSEYIECDKSDCSNRSDDSCNRKKKKKKHRRRKSDCSYDCGIKYSETPIGVWNLVYSCEDVCTTTTGTMEWINQLMLNGDGTVTVYSAPDVGTNPYPCLLTPGIGVWNEHGERKIKMELTNIGYRCSDGAAQAYYRTHILLKLNRKGNKLRFRGESCPYDLKDPTMCTPLDHPSLCFSGHGTKVLEPKRTNVC